MPKRSIEMSPSDCEESLLLLPLLPLLLTPDAGETNQDNPCYTEHQAKPMESHKFPLQEDN